MSVRAKWYGGAVQKHMEEAVAEGLFRVAEHVLEQATREVPLQEGTLMRSAVATVDKGSAKIKVVGEGQLIQEGSSVGKSKSAMVAYDTPYAARQHEETDWNHQRGRKAKYLEDPLNRAQSVALGIIGKAVREYISRGRP